MRLGNSQRVEQPAIVCRPLHSGQAESHHLRSFSVNRAENAANVSRGVVSGATAQRLDRLQKRRPLGKIPKPPSCYPGVSKNRRSINLPRSARVLDHRKSSNQSRVRTVLPSLRRTHSRPVLSRRKPARGGRLLKARSYNRPCRSARAPQLKRSCLDGLRRASRRETDMPDRPRMASRSPGRPTRLKPSRSNSTSTDHSF